MWKFREIKRSKAIFKPWLLEKSSNTLINSAERWRVLETVKGDNIQSYFRGSVSSGKYLSNHCVRSWRWLRMDCFDLTRSLREIHSDQKTYPFFCFQVGQPNVEVSFWRLRSCYSLLGCSLIHLAQTNSSPLISQKCKISIAVLLSSEGQ